MNAPIPATTLLQPTEAAVPAAVILSAEALAKATRKAIAKATAKAVAKAAVKAAALAPVATDALASTPAPVTAPAPLAASAPVTAPAPLTALAPATAPTPVIAPAPPPVSALSPAPPVTRTAPAAPGTGAPAAKSGLAALLETPERKAWYRRPSPWVVALLVALAAGGAWWWWTEQAKSAMPAYNTQAVGRGNLTLTVTANGTIQPTRSINIGSELSGTVLKVNVDVNDRIKKGQVLVELDTAKLRDQILRSKASVAAASAKVAQGSATITEASAGLGRLEAVAVLSGGKVPSKTELDASRATLARAQADVAGARAGVNEAAAALSLDQINLSKASIVAPADGIVLTRNVDPGNAVAASLQAVTLFTVAEDLAKLRLWVYVDEADVGAVKVGQSANFTVSAYLSRKFPARITRVGFGSTITDNVVTYLTYLDVDNTDLSLRPGMTATATITATERRDVLLVPNSALRFSPTAGARAAAPKAGVLTSLTPRIPGGGGNRRSAAAGASTATARQVWVLRDGAAVSVAVTPGISNGHMTEITAGDLTAGMLVITDQKSAPAK